MQSRHVDLYHPRPSRSAFLLPTRLVARFALECQTLIDEVAKWKIFEVRAYVPKSLIEKAPLGGQRIQKKKQAGGSDGAGDHATWLSMVAAMSQAVGIDLWLDGNCIRGRVVAEADKHRVQDTLLGAGKMDVHFTQY